MDKQIKTLSRDEWVLYVSKRKPLDKEFTRMTVSRYDDKRKDAIQKAEVRKQEHKQKMETDETYRDAYKEKMRKAYLKAKEKRENTQKQKEEPKPIGTSQPEQYVVKDRGVYGEPGKEPTEQVKREPLQVLGVDDIDDMFDY